MSVENIRQFFESKPINIIGLYDWVSKNEQEAEAITEDQLIDKISKDAANIYSSVRAVYSERKNVAALLPAEDVSKKVAIEACLVGKKARGGKFYLERHGDDRAKLLEWLLDNNNYCYAARYLQKSLFRDEERFKLFQQVYNSATEFRVLRKIIESEMEKWGREQSKERKTIAILAQIGRCVQSAGDTTKNYAQGAYSFLCASPEFQQYLGLLGAYNGRSKHAKIAMAFLNKLKESKPSYLLQKSDTESTLATSDGEDERDKEFLLGLEEANKGFDSLLAGVSPAKEESRGISVSPSRNTSSKRESVTPVSSVQAEVSVEPKSVGSIVLTKPSKYQSKITASSFQPFTQAELSNYFGSRTANGSYTLSQLGSKRRVEDGIRKLFVDLQAELKEKGKSLDSAEKLEKHIDLINQYLQFIVDTTKSGEQASVPDDFLWPLAVALSEGAYYKKLKSNFDAILSHTGQNDLVVELAEDAAYVHAIASNSNPQVVASLFSAVMKYPETDRERIFFNLAMDLYSKGLQKGKEILDKLSKLGSSGAVDSLTSTLLHVNILYDIKNHVGNLEFNSTQSLYAGYQAARSAIKELAHILQSSVLDSIKDSILNYERANPSDRHYREAYFFVLGNELAEKLRQKFFVPQNKAQATISKQSDTETDFVSAVNKLVGEKELTDSDYTKLAGQFKQAFRNAGGLMTSPSSDYTNRKKVFLTVLADYNHERVHPRLTRLLQEDVGNLSSIVANIQGYTAPQKRESLIESNRTVFERAKGNLLRKDYSELSQIASEFNTVFSSRLASDATRRDWCSNLIRDIQAPEQMKRLAQVMMEDTNSPLWHYVITITREERNRLQRLFFEPGVFDLLMCQATEKDRSGQPTERATNIKQLFQPFFTKNIHDGLYAVGRQDDWVKLVGCVDSAIIWPTKETIDSDESFAKCQNSSRDENRIILGACAKEDQWELEHRKKYPDQKSWFARWDRGIHMYPESGFNWLSALVSYWSGSDPDAPKYSKNLDAVALPARENASVSVISGNGTAGMTRSLRAQGKKYSSVAVVPEESALEEDADKPKEDLVSAYRRAWSPQSVLKKLDGNRLLDLFKDLESGEREIMISRLNSQKLFALYEAVINAVDINLSGAFFNQLKVKQAVAMFKGDGLKQQQQIGLRKDFMSHLCLYRTEEALSSLLKDMRDALKQNPDDLKSFNTHVKNNDKSNLLSDSQSTERPVYERR